VGTGPWVLSDTMDGWPLKGPLKLRLEGDKPGGWGINSAGHRTHPNSDTSM
jgi:hypothetical protein